MEKKLSLLKTHFSILIIDDEIELLQSLSRSLSKKYRVLTAESGDEGLKVLAETSIDCVLLDVRMPGRSGLEILKVISDSYSNIPVIIITGHGDADIVDQAIKCGATGYIDKPFSLDDLCNEIDNAIETTTQKKLFELPVEILLVDDDIELLKSLANNLRKLPYTIHSARSGEEALEIIQKQRIDILITDIRMPKMSGIQLIENGKMIQKDIMPIVITGTALGEYDSALEAMRNGAINYISKPVSLEELRISIEQGISKIKLIQELRLSNSELLYRKNLLQKAKNELEKRVEERTAELKKEINERKSLANEREKLISELKIALSNIKTLKGLLPICCSCKKIRDDEGYWNQIEVYIRDRSDADFTHSICPTCTKKLYPGI